MPLLLWQLEYGGTAGPGRRFDELAGSFFCGHLIECSNYVTGANWTGFKQFGSKGLDFGFPISEIAEDGTFVVTKEENTDGCVTIETCKSQLLYEIQGLWYFNSYVTAELTGIKFEQAGSDRAKVTGVKGLPVSNTLLYLDKYLRKTS